MDSFVQDVRYAIRTFGRTPAFSLVAILALALGIGANTAIFSIVHAVLIEPLPFSNPDRIVAVWEENVRQPGRSNTVGPANFLRWSERNTTFEQMAALAEIRRNLTGNGVPEELTAQVVTAGFFTSVLGVPARVGRSFTDAEERNPDAAVAVLSDSLWRRRFGGDPSIVGRTIQLNGKPTMVVGVMPPDFQLLIKAGALVGKPTDLWLPYVLPPEAREPHGRYLTVVARLKSGVSVSEARAQMSTIAAGLATEFPDFDTGWGVKVVPLHAELSGGLRLALLVLLGAVAFVLLIACANVANLLLARGATRQREIAIRAALGATRTRVIRQLLTESVLLGLLGGALGLLVADWSLAVLLAISPVDLSGLGQAQLSYPVLAFTGMVSILTAAICGLAPAFEGSRADVQDTLQDGSRQSSGLRSRRMRNAFVVSEIALASVLLVGAGLLLRSLTNLRHVDPGFDPRGILTMRVALPFSKYGTDSARTLFFQRAVGRIRDIPSVRDAGAISFLPFAALGAATDFAVAGRPTPPRGQEPVTDVRICDNGYFKAMRIPLVNGRLFSDREMREKANVVLVNETLVRMYFPGRDPIGERLIIDMTDPKEPTEIVGVVGDVQFSDLQTPVGPTTYWPHPQLPGQSAMTFTIRTTADPLALSPLVAHEIQSLDKDQPVSEIRTMDQWLSRSLAQARFSAILLALFAGMALLLASIGIYGVMAYAVSQRTVEIGIRLALGATRRSIVGMILLGGVRLVATGLTLGVLLALALNRALTSLLYETRGADPLTLTSVVVLLGAVALAASYVPARRASRIAPIEALRSQ